MNNCSIISGSFHENSRYDKKVITYNNGVLELVFFDLDTLENFEFACNEIVGNSSFFFKLKKRLNGYFISLISVVVILFALISSSLYEDIMKKIIFESPFDWQIDDTISILFVVLFFLGLILMPSILDGEGSEFKQTLKSWFNKDVRVSKRLKLFFNDLDKKSIVHIYNIDYLDEKHWMYRIVMPIILNHFQDINIYTRSDSKKRIQKRFVEKKSLNIELVSNKSKPFKNYEEFFSSKEDMLYTLLKLSSTNIFSKANQKIYISLEMFEYLGQNFFVNKGENNQVISGFQNFVNRCFDDYSILNQQKSNQIYFSDLIKFSGLEEDKRRLSYYLRNHIEECVEYFNNPISLLILYYYVKDVVLDERRIIKILQKLVKSIKLKQQYDLIDTYWFELAGYMFDSTSLDSFIDNKDSIYRKLSIETLDTLIFLFERNGKFEQALLLANYLFEINPNKYAIDISSLYERIGEFDKAYESLIYKAKNENKPKEVEVRYYQRKAWIIVSKRDEAKKQEFTNSLQTLETILFSHHDNNEAIWLWHFYNIKANFDEWEERYDSAISNYMKCLSVPSLGSFEYGATFINMSIAYRFKYLNEEKKDEKLINKAIYLGNIGVDLKNSVGDKDEMPVVLNNQCLNILYKLAFYEDKMLLKKAKILSKEAFGILTETNSKKRFGIVLTELIICKFLDNEDIKSELSILEKHWNSIDKYEMGQITCLNKYFPEVNMLERN